MISSPESFDVTGADDWQIAERPGKWKAKPVRLHVSLNRRGEFVMNEAAFIAIRRPASVALLYNKDTKEIAIKFPVREDRFFFKVRRCGRGGKGRIVRAGRMMKQFGIEVVKTVVFQDVRIETIREHNALILDAGSTDDLRISNSDMKTEKENN